MKIPSIKKDVPAISDEGPFREIEIKFSRWQSPCDMCKKVVIVAGMPDRIHARVRMTDEQWNLVVEHIFYVSPHFAFHCLGVSHIVDKTKAPLQWIISDTDEWGPDPSNRTGIVEIGTHFERVLSDFIPRFVEKILREQIPANPRFPYIEPPAYEQALGRSA